MTAPLDRLVSQVVTQVRWRRAEHYGLRGAFYGALTAVALLVFKTALGRGALVAAVAAYIVGILGGALYGFTRRVIVADAARLADRAFGLSERVSTALEWAEHPDRTPLVDALVADAVQRIESLPVRQIVPRILPREVRLLPIPVLAAVVLTLAPAVPLPSGRLPDFHRASDGDEKPERTDSRLVEESARPLRKDPEKRPVFGERDFAQRSGGAGGATAGDLSAIFKDTALASQRPDFNSFLKKGDERLKMLEQVDRLPDLQSDFTASQYKMVFKKSKELRSGLRPDQVSPQKLKELLEEMERLGRKGGSWGSDAMDGMEALEGGNQDKAMQAMEKALNKMRAQEEASRGGKNLRGGRERGNPGNRRGERGAGEGMGPEDQDFGEGEGSMPGKGRSGSPKGEASQRLRASPYDVGVEGESRNGRKDGYDTNMSGRGSKMPSRMPYLGVIGQYRKMMEDSISREQVPRDYHAQIKDYFQALDER